MEGILGTLLGAFMGWILNEWSTTRKEKPKLCFQLVDNKEYSASDKELHTNTSPSEYGIEIFNLGKEPVFVEHFDILSQEYKDQLITSCCLFEENRVILPYHNVVCILNEEELDAIRWHCDQRQFRVCDIIAYTGNHKEVKSELNIELFAIQAKIKAECQQNKENHHG